MKNAAFSGLPVFMLVMGFFAIGCDTPTNGEGDTWTDLTSLNQIEGTWKGSYSETMTLREFVEGQGGTWTDSFATTYGDMRVTISNEIIFTFNAGTSNQTGSMKTVYTFSGGNIGVGWSALKEWFTEEGPWEFDDQKHSASGTPYNFSNSLAMDDMAGVQINQNGTRVKVPEGLMGSGMPEIIFTKQ
jgi:hypothetical protein